MTDQVIIKSTFKQSKWRCPKCGKEGIGEANEKEHYNECLLTEIVKSFTDQLGEKDKEINKLKKKLKRQNWKN